MPNWKKDYKAGCTPITSRIVCGKILKNGSFSDLSRDITDTAVHAVAKRLYQINETYTFSNREGDKLELGVNNKKEFYQKSLLKLQKIEKGEMTLNDYIKEIEDKINL